MSGANLGLATTRELLDEIAARISVDYSSGGGGLNYTTVGGRPTEAAIEGPHSRACGHGDACSIDCPTCGVPARTGADNG